MQFKKKSFLHEEIMVKLHFIDSGETGHIIHNIFL